MKGAEYVDQYGRSYVVNRLTSLADGGWTRGNRLQFLCLPLQSATL